MALSVTKEHPKEMLPVFAMAKDRSLCLKPIVQLVFEQLHRVGFGDVVAFNNGDCTVTRNGSESSESLSPLSSGMVV